jgi:flagellar FliL protein
MPEETQRSQESQDVRKKGKGKMLLVLPVLLIALGGGYLLYAKKLASKPQAVEAKKEEKKGIGPILSLEPFLFNLRGGNSKFARVSIGLEVRDEKVLEEAKKMVPALRDRILSFLSSKTGESFLDAGQREEMKVELQAHLKGLFKEESDLKNVYITDIVIQ